MLDFIAHEESGLPAVVVAGDVRVLGCLPRPTVQALPVYEDAFDIVPESLWPDNYNGIAPYFPYLWDQNGQGSCGGHAEGAAFTATWAFGGKTPREFSPTFTYGMVNGGTDRGSVIADLLAAGRDKGHALFSTVGPKDIYARNYKAEALQEATRFKIDQAYFVSTYKGLVSAILRNQALVGGIWVGNRFEPDRDGYLPEQQGSGGGHALAFMKFRKYGGKPWIGGPNSWSKSWGLNGWFWMPPSYFQNGLTTAGFGFYAILPAAEDPQDRILPVAK